MADLGGKKSRPWVTPAEFHKAPSSEVIVQKFGAGIVKAEDGDDDRRIARFTITTPDVDRDNDTIETAGWQLEAYEANPVVLWAHSRNDLPIGKAIELERADGSLQSTAEFADHELALNVYNLIKGGFLRATSVGFRPLEWKENQERGGIDFTKQELVEFSVVPVPANPHALIAAKAEGLSLDILRKWLAEVLGSWPEEELDLPRGAWEKILGERPAIRRVTQVGDLKASLTLDKDGMDEGLDEVGERLAQLEARIASVHNGLDGLRQGLRDLPDVAGRSVAQFPVRSRKDEAETEDPIRWNKSLSEDFDIREEDLPPKSVEEELAAKHCGVAVKELHYTTLDVCSARMGAFLLSLDEYLADESVACLDVRNIDQYGKEAAPLRRTIQLNSKRTGTFLVNGMRFLEIDGVKTTLRVMPTWFGLRVRSYAGQEVAGVAEEFLGDVRRHASQLKLLKGEKFSLSGEFLELGGEKFSDVFLADKNAAAITRAATLIGEEGTEMENRGLLFIGPPGTGKTMSGKALMNEAKDATFIWLAARDFYYGGGFGAMEQAFELARENAPSIIFIEDVDSYLSDHVTDLIKTEMDGIKSSTGITTILTSNYPERLPKAIIDRPGRFHDVLRFDLPDATARQSMLERWLPDLEGKALAHVIEELRGYSGAHVREFARFATVIRDQEGLTIDAAANAALAKIQEQRDLITSVQASGSQYRAPDHVLEKDQAVADEGGEIFALEIIEPEEVPEYFELSDGGEEEPVLDLDPTDLAKAVSEGTRLAVQEYVKGETIAAVDYLRGRV